MWLIVQGASPALSIVSLVSGFLFGLANIEHSTDIEVKIGLLIVRDVGIRFILLGWVVDHESMLAFHDLSVGFLPLPIAADYGW